MSWSLPQQGDERDELQQRWPKVQVLHFMWIDPPDVRDTWNRYNSSGGWCVESSEVVQSNKKRGLALCWRSHQTFKFYVTHHNKIHEHPHQSKRLHQHREQQGEVLGASDREFVCCVEVDDFRDGVEGRAVLSQHVLAVFALGELHVHETLAAPERKRKNRKGGLRKGGDKRKKRPKVRKTCRREKKDDMKCGARKTPRCLPHILSHNDTVEVTAGIYVHVISLHFESVSLTKI